MLEVCAVFAYHEKLTDVVKHHYACACKCNPGIPIVPVMVDCPAVLPNTVELKDRPTLWRSKKEDLWWHCDQLLWRYLLGEHIEAERYIFLEYDVYFHDMGLKEFFGEAAWNAAVSSVHYRYWTMPNRPAPWHWWDGLDCAIPAEHICAGIPMACSLWRRDAAMYVAHTDPESIMPGFNSRLSEVRSFTTARIGGFQVTQPIPNRERMCNSHGYIEHLAKVERGVWHPIKMIL